MLPGSFPTNPIAIGVSRPETDEMTGQLTYPAVPLKIEKHMAIARALFRGDGFWNELGKPQDPTKKLEPVTEDVPTMHVKTGLETRDFLKVSEPLRSCLLVEVAASDLERFEKYFTGVPFGTGGIFGVSVPCPIL